MVDREPFALFYPLAPAVTCSNNNNANTSRFYLLFPLFFEIMLRFLFFSVSVLLLSQISLLWVSSSSPVADRRGGGAVGGRLKQEPGGGAEEFGSVAMEKRTSPVLWLRG